MERNLVKKRNKGQEILNALNEKKIVILLTTIFFIGYFFTTNAYCATADTSSIDNIIKWIATWISRVGVGVAFFGGVQLVLGFKQEDPNAKTAGLKTLASGFMLVAICQSLSIFGIV